MSVDLPEQNEDLVVRVELLDPEFGKPVKTWKFVDKHLITVGRSEDRDVEVVDTYVSRKHANLAFREGRWVLVSLGMNGVLVEEVMITEKAIEGTVQFRLGVDGPLLRFLVESVDEASEADGSTTTCQTRAFAYSNPTPKFQLDKRKLEDEVGAIMEGGYFQTLQKRAKQLREQRDSR